MYSYQPIYLKPAAISSIPRLQVSVDILSSSIMKSLPTYQVEHIPNLCGSIKHGLKLRNKGTSVYLTKGSASVMFDRDSKTFNDI
jgi:hypothetical protein